MAKKRQFEEEEQQEEISVVILRFKGSGDTLRKGFDTVSQALTTIGAPARLTPKTAVTEVVEVTGQEPETVTDLQEDDGTEPRRPKATTNSERKSAGTFLSDFNLIPSGSIAWKEFAAKSPVDSDQDRYLIAAYWIQKHAGCETFTGNHVFTCFRTMKWRELEDFTKPMRNMKQNNSYFDTPTRRSWKLNQHGIEAAEALLRP